VAGARLSVRRPEPEAATPEGVSRAPVPESDSASEPQAAGSGGAESLSPVSPRQS
jgi:hypothetical protein